MHPFIRSLKMYKERTLIRLLLHTEWRSASLSSTGITVVGVVLCYVRHQQDGGIIVIIKVIIIKVIIIAACVH